MNLLRKPTIPLHRQDSRGSVVPVVVVALVVVGVIAFVVWRFLSGSEEVGEEPILSRISRGDFEHVVLEQGEVESSNNVEVRCMVKAGLRGTTGSTTILDIIPEGTQVQEGDWLVTFDSSALENERLQQQIIVNNAKTKVIQSEAALQIAKKAKTEYEEGTFKELEQTILNEMYVAEQNLSTAQQYLIYSEKLASRNFVTPLQLESDRFAVEKAKNELDLAQRKLKVLREHTYEKMMTQLTSDIKSAEVTLNNDQASLIEEERKLQEIDEQIALCTVTAPQAGQVVYANVQSRRSSSEVVIEPGAQVREQQVVIRLPDPKNMQVKATISETRITLVREGQPVSVKIDAIGDKPLKGVVTKVNRYAEPGNWWSAAGKEYLTYVRVLDPPKDTRTGLTAEVKIHIDTREDVLQIPVQAVYEHKGHTFCLVKNGDAFETRKIAIASTNDKFVAIDEQASEKIVAKSDVVMNPRDHISLFDFTGYKLAPPPVPVETEALAADDSPGGNAPSDEGGPPTSAAATSPAAMVQGLLDRFDTDKDGNLSADEMSSVPAMMSDRLREADANSDGAIDRIELTVAAGALAHRMREFQDQGEAGGGE